MFELDQDQQSWQDIYGYSKGRLQTETRFAALAEPAARLIADRADNKFLFARMGHIVAAAPHPSRLARTTSVSDSQGTLPMP